MLDTTTHPPDEAIEAFALGNLDPTLLPGLEEHLASCDHCQDRAEAIDPDPLMQLLAAAHTRGGPQTATPPPTAASTPSFPPTQGWVNNDSDSAEDTEVPPVLARHPKYRVLRCLGTGGMGTVWLAQHTVMSRPVAVKVIRPDLLARPAAKMRFLREVRAAARLHHPNIVTAFDAESVDGSCLLVMEYVPGETLAERVKAGPLPVVEACRAVRDAARGLAHAHTAGLVHRDVKPHNLIRAADGTVKVLDFGLAGAATEVVAAAGADLTGMGMVCGTPDYIAPEQAANPNAADARADVYGLGCTLYHLLAGRPPVPAGSVVEKIAAQETRLPDPILGLPVGLDAVLTRMMAKRPEDRYQSADEVASALLPFADGASRKQKAGTPRNRVRTLVAAALLFTGLVATLGAVYKIQRDNEEITITTNDPDIEVVMKRKGELVCIRDPRSGQTWELNTLTNQVGLADQPEGLKLELPGREPFVLRRKGHRVFTVTWAPIESDEKLIQGEWQPVAAELGGEALPKELSDTLKPRATFSAGKVMWRVEPPAGIVRLLEGQGGKAPLPLPKELAAVLKRGAEGVYHLDPTKTPRAIDLVWLGPVRKTLLGIYSLKGNTLKLSMAIDPERADQRPTDFVTRPGVMKVTMTFRRLPSKKSH